MLDCQTYSPIPVFSGEMCVPTVGTAKHTIHSQSFRGGWNEVACQISASSLAGVRGGGIKSTLALTGV